MRLVFIDLETGGLDCTRHPITQIAAVAVDEQLRELEAFETKVQFDERQADPEALAKSHYDAAVWARDAIAPRQATDALSAFFKRYADVKMVSQRTGRDYFVAQLAGYNAATFDGPFLQAMYRQHDAFLPATYRVMCCLQRVLWHFHYRPEHPQPIDFKLGSVCQHFGITLDGAHDALADVRATVELCRALGGLRLNERTTK